jgi:hypothetical protein
VAALVAAGIAPGAQAQQPPRDPPLLDVVDGREADRLVRLDPRTLRAHGRSLPVFPKAAAAAFSPDGRLLAYGDASWRGASLQVVDLMRWRSRPLARLGGGLLALAWLSDDRLLAVVRAASARQRLVWIDTTRRRLVARHTVAGRLGDARATESGHALLVAPRRGTGAARLVVGGAAGGVRTVRLDRILAGFHGTMGRGRYLKPALAVDRESGRAYVVAADSLLVAEVELASGAVTYHALGAGASKGNVETLWRDAAWAGDGQLAVTGERHPRPGRRRRSPSPIPFGVRLIDTRDWSIRTLDTRPSVMQVAGNTILAHGSRWYDGWRRSESSGLLAYDSSGRRAFRRFRGQDVLTLGSRGRFAYVWVRPTRMLHVIDLRDGRSINAMPRPPRRVHDLLTPLE